jgi:hypothetical protein
MAPGGARLRELAPDGFIRVTVDGKTGALDGIVRQI